MNNVRTMLVLCLGFFSTGQVMGATTINDTNRYAYGANVGWVNAQGDTNNGVVIGEAYCSGYAWAGNIGWINMGQGPTNGIQYSNAAADDFGVNHDGEGGLSGFAYGANVGWINFETNGNPRVSLLSGELTGYAYGANIGWISLSNNFAFVQTDSMDTGPDVDGDGIPDAWELAQVGDITTLSNTNDLDGDGVLDHHEYGADTDPNNSGEYLWLATLSLTNSTDSKVSWPTDPARVYTLESTPVNTNNAAWSDTGIYAGLGTGGTVTGLVGNADTTTRFFRVRANVPLSK